MWFGDTIMFLMLSGLSDVPGDTRPTRALTPLKKMTVTMTTGIAMPNSRKQLAFAGKPKEWRW